MGYVYCIKHVPTGKLYIGSRIKKNRKTDEFFLGEFKKFSRKSYWTSSKIIHALLEKDGKESFEIIFCRESENAYEEETNLLLQHNAKFNSNFLNTSNNIVGGLWSPSNSVWINNGVCEKYISFSLEVPVGFTKGRLAQSDEVRQKKGKPGKKWYNNGIESCMLFPNEVPSGYISGRMRSTKKQKFKETKCPHCCAIGRMTNMKRYHFDNCKLLTNIGKFCEYPRLMECSKIFQCDQCNAEVKGISNLTRWHNDNCKLKL